MSVVSVPSANETANTFLVKLVDRDSQEEIVYYNPDGESLTIDLRSVIRTLNRLGEVAFVNVSTAPALMAALNKAWLDLGDLVTVTRHRLAQAQDWLKTERSRILIDEVPELLKERQLSNSKDNRDALIERHAGYQRHRETVHELEAILTWLIDRRDAVKNAWNAVRAILGDRGGVPLSGRSPYTSGGTTGATRISPHDQSPWGETRLD